jgi:hypothetical protein
VCETTVTDALDTCPKCECTDLRKSTCRKRVAEGKKKCYLHGSNAAQVLKAADERQLEQRLKRLLGRYDQGAIDDPLGEFAKLGGDLRAWVDLTGDAVASIPVAEWRYEHRAGEQVRGEIVLHERAVDRYARYLVEFNRLRIDDRLVASRERLDRAHGALVLAAAEGFVAWIRQAIDRGAIPTEAQARERMAIELKAAEDDR